ncbi:hypothetical protein [Reichenbachiella agariperforans]|uniref:hypothetical protein n=1 Tax=Reichenbachiella agariperforans TaxID=156994 RepID=UPI001C09A961|nr:hypothetical protein [Reichenbachiella agariperforans]MBU2913266.1 hypothetical protein [Reichenbachiella agariperforans]
MKNVVNQFSLRLMLALASIVFVTSCSSDDNTEEPDLSASAKIQLSNDAALGEILTDAKGVTLYVFAKDVAGTSACLDGCLDAWPIYYAEDAEIGTGLEATDFSSITHSNGEKQTTYKGWPLYYFSPSGDGVIETAGSTAGDGAGSAFHVAKPDYTIMLANTQLVGVDGKNYTSEYVEGEGATSYFVNASGRALYIFTNDTKDTNNFTASDFSNDGVWPVYTKEIEAVVSSINADDFGSIDVFGESQLTYKGWPLYYFGQDTDRGDTKGVSVPAPGVWPVATTDLAAAEEVIVETTIMLSTDNALGELLTDAEGHVLYYLAKDVAGTRNCTGGCADSWPVFYTAEIEVGEGLDAEDFENIEQDGDMITTYKGWPLYYHSESGDGVIDAVGNTSGQGLGGVWYVMKDYSIMLAKGQLIGADGKNYLEDYTEGEGETTYFTSAWGKTLYAFNNDSKDTNTFTNEDFSNDGSWPIYHVTVDQLPAAMDAADFGEIEVFGEMQLTFKGWPVYYYGGDSDRGENKGVSVPSPGVWPIINNSTVAAE